MANQEQLKLLRKGVKVWNQRRKKNSDIALDLCEVDLREANLSGVDLCKVDLSGADLRGADLHGSARTKH